MSIDVIMDDVLIFMIAIKIWGKAGKTIGFCPKNLLVIFFLIWSLIAYAFPALIILDLVDLSSLVTL